MIWSLIFWAHSVSAADRGEKFLQELRKREYFDTALDYLEGLNKQPGLTSEFRNRAGFERGLILRDWASRQVSPEQIQASQKQAQKEFANFLAQQADHPLAGQAWSELGQLLQMEAKSLGLQAQRAVSPERKQQQLEDSRQKLKQAREAFQQALVRQQKEYEAFPKFIDKEKEPERFEARRAVETNVVQTRLNLAILAFDEALFAPPQDRREHIAKAYDQSAKIYEEYRSQLAGMYARLYQGRCRLELHQNQEALGIFQELLTLRVDDPAILALQDQALMYRLQIWNADSEKKYEQVAQEAQSWLKAHTDRSRSRAGQGIRWELAKAYEALARKNEKNSDLEEAEYQRSLAVARELSLQPGEFQTAARQLVNRLSQILHRDTGEAKDFDGAFAQAGDTIRLLQGLQDSLDHAEKEEDKTRLRDDMNLQLREAARQLQFTLSMVRPGTSVEQVCRVRYWLCYVYYLTGRMDEAAIVGEFLARKFHQNQALGTLPLDAAYLAMAAYSQACNAPDNPDKQVEIRRMISLCNFLVATWPKESKAEEAMLMLGRLYSEVDDPQSAASWFDRIDSASPLALDAQLGAGTAYWNAYLHLRQNAAADKVDDPKLKEYAETARTKLQRGIEETEKKADEAAPPADTLRLAKLTLAQIENEAGKFKAARDLLYGSPLSVLGTHPEPQPEVTRNTGLATEAYRQWLRAAIGLKNLQEAQFAMKGLEQMQGGTADLYVALGNQFQQELERVRGKDAQRETELLGSFEAFLKALSAHPEGNKFGTMAWIGETWLKLADAIDDPSHAKPYVDQAADLFQAILQRADKEPDFVTPEQRVAVEFRLVSCLRRSGEFERSLANCQKLLKQRPQSLELQMEMAKIYEGWGETGGPNAAAHWSAAIQGQDSTDPATPTIWGWAGITTRLNRQLEKQSAEKLTPENKSPDKKANEGLVNQVLDARYHVAYCRLKEALQQSTGEEREKTLQRAAADIQYTVAQRELNETWYQKFNSLWFQILQAEGKSPTPLPRTGGPAVSPETTQATHAATPSGPASSKNQRPFPISFPVMAVICVTLVGVFLLVFLNRPRRTRTRYSKYSRKQPTTKL
ncbi:MAG: hypothetical protein U0903_16730 [Planctomycetales bacterium]